MQNFQGIFSHKNPNSRIPDQVVDITLDRHDCESNGKLTGEIILKILNEEISIDYSRTLELKISTIQKQVSYDQGSKRRKSNQLEIPLPKNYYNY